MNNLLLFLVFFISCSLNAKTIIEPVSGLYTNILIENLLSNGEREIFLAKGTHFFSKTLKSDLNNLKISGDGVIKIKSPMPLLFDLRGNNLTISVNIDGENKLESALKLVGNNNTVSNSSIKNLKSNKNSSIAIELNTNGSFRIENNIINGIYSKSDQKNGNRVGAARAISIFRRNPDSIPDLGYILRNKIYNIWGEEGDAITLWSRNNIAYSSVNVNVFNNNIKNYSRRAIKIQGSDAFVKSNKIENHLNKKYIYNCSSAISVYVAKNILIENNSINDNVCSALNVFMKKDSVNIEDVGNVIINNNKVFGNKIGFKIGGLKVPDSHFKDGKFSFISKDEIN